MKDQTTTIQATPQRAYRSFWYVILLQSQNGRLLVDKENEGAVSSLVDKILPDAMNSKAQDFTNITNRKEPFFSSSVDGSVLIYPVKPQPIIEEVYVWTDGKQMIITLKKIAEHFVL